MTVVDGEEFSDLLSSLLDVSQRATPGELPDLVRDTTRKLGLLDAVIYLADLQQMRLTPLAGVRAGVPAPGAVGGEAAGLAVDGTLAGWAYRTGATELASGSELVMWVPLVDGAERIGVLRLIAPAMDATTLEQCQSLAALVAKVVMSKAGFSDMLLRSIRTQPMTLQAEMAWAFMPPRTIGTRSVTSSAVLEPAYEIGGDAFDHSLTARSLHVTVVDAMGHDLASGLCAAVALAGCRSTRRSGGDLTDITATVDEALNEWLPERLLTAIFADLDVETGDLSWVNCGHPAPLLIRRHHVVADALRRDAQLPLGINPHHAPRVPNVIHHAQLEPGDRILIHTDGVTEARSDTGEQFGEERLIDTVVRATAAGEAAPEALRRLVRGILDHHHGHLRDDATILLAEWHPRSEQTADSAA
ncbi:serine/threonine-protein phosphatase [Streptomyces sp. APSN-46.1]|uniref:PP2C family protein-serine/threonine phosphatase n=1 Tax=Streptomyces sp. APSN-46.1 TaxID=2929049 RepID=UPI001FB3F256|nr:PP2C family protein-serine/threonine phosphatase [Streptomyces sp. APSN-46.1]MCJ1678487.1 serine/threonine-protein phosphatase [Streptomyces sp. APSN-46.1]